VAEDRSPPLPVPVLLVAGALGAGKTTLINTLLGADHGLALAVVVNDFGALNIDAALLAASGQPVYGLKNGCICCSLQGDLLRTLRTILSVGANPDAIVLEASGVSDPRGIIAALLDPVLREAVRLDAVVTVIDAEDHDPLDALWTAQVRAADFLCLTKTATLPAGDLAALHARLAPLHKALVFDADADSGIPLAVLFDRGRRHRDKPATGERTVDDLPHIRDDRFVRLEWSSPTPISLPRFQAMIQALAPQLARAKGFLSVREHPEQALLFQLVGRRASLTPAGAPRGGTQLVFIGKAGLFDGARVTSALETITQA